MDGELGAPGDGREAPAPAPATVGEAGVEECDLYGERCDPQPPPPGTMEGSTSSGGPAAKPGAGPACGLAPETDPDAMRGRLKAPAGPCEVWLSSTLELGLARGCWSSVCMAAGVWLLLCGCCAVAPLLRRCVSSTVHQVIQPMLLCWAAGCCCAVTATAACR